MTHEEMRTEVMKRIKHGQILRIRDEDDRSDKVTTSTVVAFYENYVLCHGLYNLCYSYYELWTILNKKQRKAVIPKYIKG